MIRLFRLSIPTVAVWLVLTNTVLLFGAYLLAAYFFFNIETDLGFYLRYQDGWMQFVFVVAAIQIGLYLQDWYRGTRQRSALIMVQELCVVLGGAFLLQSFLTYGQWEALQLPQRTMLFGSLMVLVVLPVWNKSVYLVLPRLLPAERVIFLGATPVCAEIARGLHERHLGFITAGYVADQPDGDPQMGPHLGSFTNVHAIAQQYKPHRVIVSTDAVTAMAPTLLDLRYSGITIERETSFYETVFGRVALQSLRPSDLIFSSDFQPKPFSLALQAVYSPVLGVIGLLLSLPLMIPVALLVRFTSPGPVFFRQTRVGLHGSVFSLYKFRSMYVNAEAATGPVWAKAGDPRITPLGRWLRRLRLDELPQFFNVVRGEMALVGPRPERPEFCKILEEKIPYYAQRHVVKPGITGWAQINHDYTDNIEDTATKLAYDLYYIRNLTPSLDAYILLDTIKVMLLTRGAR